MVDRGQCEWNCGSYGCGRKAVATVLETEQRMCAMHFTMETAQVTGVINGQWCAGLGADRGVAVSPRASLRTPKPPSPPAKGAGGEDDRDCLAVSGGI